MRGKRWMTDRRVNIISVYWSDPSANIDSFPSKTAGIMQFPSSVMQPMCRKDSCLTSPFSQERELKPGAIWAVKKHRRFLLRMPAFCFSLWTAFVIGETKILKLRKHNSAFLWELYSLYYLENNSFPVEKLTIVVKNKPNQKTLCYANTFLLNQKFVLTLSRVAFIVWLAFLSAFVSSFIGFGSQFSFWLCRCFLHQVCAFFRSTIIHTSVYLFKWICQVKNRFILYIFVRF